MWVYDRDMSLFWPTILVSPVNQVRRQFGWTRWHQIDDCLVGGYVPCFNRILLMPLVLQYIQWKLHTIILCFVFVVVLSSLHSLLLLFIYSYQSYDLFINFRIALSSHESRSGKYDCSKFVKMYLSIVYLHHKINVHKNMKISLNLIVIYFMLHPFSQVHDIAA